MPQCFARVGPEGLPARLQLPERGVAALEPHDLGVFLGLEVLVDAEEVLDLVEEMLWQIFDVLSVVPLWVVLQDGQQLGVEPRLVAHEKDAEDPGPDDAAREGGVRHQHQRVERVPVLRQGVGHEAIVGRIRRGREQPAVEADDVILVVVLVLVATAGGDFDHHVDGSCRGRHKAPNRTGWLPPSLRRGKRPEPALIIAILTGQVAVALIYLLVRTHLTHPWRRGTRGIRPRRRVTASLDASACGQWPASAWNES